MAQNSKTLVSSSNPASGALVVGPGILPEHWRTVVVIKLRRTSALDRQIDRDRYRDREVKEHER